MGDMGDLYRAHKQSEKIRRAENYRREQPEKKLQENGLSYETKNGGVHLIVKGNLGMIDFWPTTGRWKARYQNQIKNGIGPLIKEALR